MGEEPECAVFGGRQLPPERPSFPAEEEKVLEYWSRINAFKKSYEQSREEKRPLFSFYDGPPFATGLPHYGNLLAGTIKDVLTRFAHQNGFCVERRFGWDCHGLPVEYEIDKALGVTSRQDIVTKIGIANYNDKCRSIVMRYSKEWRIVTERIGRWIDFDNDYKTMDSNFIESVWWTFKELFKKQMIYRAFKVMPYSTACATPLSNFEANQNYKECSDPSIVVAFKLVTPDLSNTALLAWTTTPWTLPSNLALCVSPTLSYVKVKPKFQPKKPTAGKPTPAPPPFLNDDPTWIIAASRVKWLESQIKNVSLEILGEPFLGTELGGLQYQPLFDFFYKEPWKERAFRVMIDAYVEDESGTGVVHCAPAFGEDDYRVCSANGVLGRVGCSSEIVCPVDADGNFTDEVAPWLQGMGVKQADKPIRDHLKGAGSLLVNSEEVHSYPFCWRSDTPLIYKAVPSWFIRVEPMRERLVKAVSKTQWVPESIKEGRFKNWIANARDWCVSRNRYWGAPIPLWVSSDFSQIVCVGSRQELEELTGKTAPEDLHREFVDELTIPDPRGAELPPLRRVEEVFDCWFESGSMPIAQNHYPFENIEKFKESFPAQFIAEGLDQTRGWFYTLLILSVALFDKAPFENVVVNGLVLASDGKKMSKRLKNYPDPSTVISSHGADALRLYLINSPVVRAEFLRFKEDAVKDTVKDVILPWYHAYRFLSLEISQFEKKENIKLNKKDGSQRNILDKWIFISSQNLILFFNQEMKHYRLYTVVPKLIKFLNDLTNWYLRLNRDRMRGQFGKEEAQTSLTTLLEVLLIITTLMAPFTPFITEAIYQKLRIHLAETTQSVHFQPLPKPSLEFIDSEIEEAVDKMQKVVVAGRLLRDRKKVSLKSPVKSLSIICPTDREMNLLNGPLLNYIREELNVLELSCSTDASAVKLVANPNFKLLGQRVGKDMQNIARIIKALDSETLLKFERDGAMTIEGHDLGSEEIIISRVPVGAKPTPAPAKGKKGAAKNDEAEDAILVESAGAGITIVMDFQTDDKMKLMTLGREVVNRIQKMRKELALKAEDDTPTFIRAIDFDFSVLSSIQDYIEKYLRRKVTIHENELKLETNLLRQQSFDIAEDWKVEITLFGC